MRWGIHAGESGSARRVTVGRAEWLVVASLVALFVLRALVPAWERVSSDFPNYYLAARLLREGYPLDRIYEWVWFQRQKDHAGIGWGTVSYGPITPFSLLVMTPFAGLPALAAKRCWLFVDLVLLGATVALLRRMSSLPLRRVALVVFLTVVPLRTNFELGQQYVLILFLLSLGCWLLVEGNAFAAGAVVGVASLLKLYPASLVVLFVVRRRWSALAGFFVAVASAGAAGIGAFGLAPLRVYLTSVLPRVGRGEVHDPYYLPTSTPTVLLRRLFVAEPDLNPHPWIDAPFTYVLAQPTVQALLLVSAVWFVVRHRDDPAREPLLWGAVSAWPLVLSTGSSTYHFCTLVLTTVLVVDALLAAKRVRLAWCLVVLHGLVCAPLYRFVPVALSGSSIFLGVPRLYALLAYWGVVLGSLATLAPPTPRPRHLAPAFAWLFAALTLIGVASASHHFDGQFESYASRVAVANPSLLATTPAAAKDAVYFSQMEDERYTLARTVGGTTVPAQSGDVFHPAISQERHELWVEIAGETSRVVRFPLDDTADARGRRPMEIANAEDPAVTGDGRRLGFLREDRGRGTLWVVDRPEGREDGMDPLTPRRVVDPRFDVLDFAFFPDGRVVFSAREGSDARLFVADAVTGVATPLGEAGRFPAVSPDGRRVAFSRRAHGTWQLALFDISTRVARVLTHADCNAMTPTWTLDGEGVVYSSDCGRGLGTTALCELHPGPASP